MQLDGAFGADPAGPQLTRDSHPVDCASRIGGLRLVQRVLVAEVLVEESYGGCVGTAGVFECVSIGFIYGKRFVVARGASRNAPVFYVSRDPRAQAFQRERAEERPPDVQGV